MVIAYGVGDRDESAFMLSKTLSPHVKAGIIFSDYFQIISDLAIVESFLVTVTVHDVKHVLGDQPFCVNVRYRFIDVQIAFQIIIAEFSAMSLQERSVVINRIANFGKRFSL